MTALFTRMLDDVGDGTGNPNMAVDGSSTPVRFKLSSRAHDNYLRIHRLHVTIQDAGKWDSDGYGAGAALPVGLEVGAYDKDNHQIMWDVLDGYTLRSNAAWAHVSDNIQFLSFDKNQQDNFMKVRADFPIPLIITPERYFGFVVQDDMTHLIAQTVYCTGEIG